MKNLKVKHIDDDKIIIYLSGRIDVSLANELDNEFNQVVTDKKASFVVLNMKGVEYISSSGFRVAISLLRKLKAVKGVLRICSLTKEVRRAFDIIELASVFEIFDSEEQALST